MNTIWVQVVSKPTLQDKINLLQISVILEKETRCIKDSTLVGTGRPPLED